MKSVVKELNTQTFPRVRVGIGLPDEDVDLIEYVIGPIDEEDISVLEKGVQEASEAVIEILKNGIDIAMNKFN